MPFADNYLTRLATRLPDAEVGNFGVSGAGPREYREILERDVWAGDQTWCWWRSSSATTSPSRCRGRVVSIHAIMRFICSANEAGSWPTHAGKVRLRQLFEPSNRLAAPALSPEIFAKWKPAGWRCA